MKTKTIVHLREREGVEEEHRHAEAGAGHGARGEQVARWPGAALRGADQADACFPRRA